MDSTDIRLRPCQPSDFDTLYEIDQSCFPPGVAYTRFQLKFYLRSPGSYCRIAEVSGEIAAFILAEFSAEYGHIVTLDVLEQFRRLGIGTLLLDAAERHATSRNISRMVLETATTNKAAIALWKRHGYRQVVTIKNYYGRGQDAFEMQKMLSDQAAV